MNIPSYSSGTNPWGTSVDSNYQPQAINDGRVEVIGCFTSTLVKKVKIIKQFYFDPKLIKFQLIKNEENMTIIHRSLFSQDFDNFIDLIKISRKELKKIMNNILMVIKISVECEEFENLTLPYKLIITFLDYLVDILSFNSEVEYLTYLKGISSILEGISSILILI